MSGSCHRPYPPRASVGTVGRSGCYRGCRDAGCGGDGDPPRNEHRVRSLGPVRGLRPRIGGGQTLRLFPREMGRGEEIKAVSEEPSSPSPFPAPLPPSPAPILSPPQGALWPLPPASLHPIPSDTCPIPHFCPCPRWVSQTQGPQNALWHPELQALVSRPLHSEVQGAEDGCPGPTVPSGRPAAISLAPSPGRPPPRPPEGVWAPPPACSALQVATPWQDHL